MRTAADRRARIVAGFSNQSGGQWAGRAAAPPSSSTTALTTIGIADRSHESCDSGFNSFYTSIFSLATVLYGNYYKEVATGGKVCETVVDRDGQTPVFVWRLALLS